MLGPRNERVFDPNASIVLVGCRGAGKRTLGFMGALHLRRRLVTEDHYFEKLTGISRGQFLLQHGKDLFARQDVEIFKRMLDSNRFGCIIECGMSSLNEEAQDALREYCRTNPVIYIHREREQIAALLDATDATALLKADEKHRECSNFEFYNLDDSATHCVGTSTSADCRQTVPSKLLNVREDFTKFLDQITGRGATKAWLESPFSVVAIPPEFRSYSYTLRLRLSYLQELDMALEEFEASADCVEFIIDQWPGDVAEVVSKQVALLRRKLGLPIIYHVEENPRGQRRRAPEEKDPVDSDLLELGLRLGVEYLSVDLQRDESLIQRALRYKGRSKVIGNYWYMGFGAPPWHDDQHLENYRRAQSLGCDLVRMARFSTGDSPVGYLESFKKRVEQTIPNPRPPLVAYDFSVLGIRTPLQSKILNPVKHRDMDTDHDFLAIINTYSHSYGLEFQQFLLDPLEFYVTGSNVSWSLSPAMQNAAYEFSGMPHTFQAVTCSTLDRLTQICLSDTFGGASLTAPFKLAIMPQLKVKSHHATAIGAVNVVLPLRGKTNAILDHANSRNKAGAAQEFFGDNTDWSSIFTCLRRAISPRNYVQPSKTTGLVIGAGGMARAAIYALIQLGCRNIFIYNRTVERAREVANHFNNWAKGQQGMVAMAKPSANASQLPTLEICRVIERLADPWPEGYQLPTMVISCVPATSLDGTPPADFVMPEGWLRSPTGGVVVELAYEPLITPLVAQMYAYRDQVNPSWVVVDGLEVVAEMAIEAFELMTGRMAPKRLMKDVCRRTWEQQQRGGGDGASGLVL
ncbi:hypothetical protein B0T13DRAFT_395879 [Neurospora crassa]|nr:hypothetical protein B0T13DRAFT_395879 [Neurospora crassa]